ncbi:MAG: ribbon-helix-helix protein, CopG family [Cyanobacteriota bacterium]
MSRTKLLQIRLSEYEFKQLQQEAEKQDVSMSDLVRKYISRLPKPTVKKPS